MLSFLQTALNKVSYLVTQMNMTQWIIAGLCLVVVGFMCMRGYGSRSTY